MTLKQLVEGYEAETKIRLGPGTLMTDTDAAISLLNVDKDVEN